MKKFWEKHDLFKVAGIMVLFTVLLTWLIPQGYLSGAELTIGEVTRVGIFDFFTYGLLGMYYFTVLITFIFVLGGFYQVLAKTSAYNILTEKIAKIFKGKEVIFVLMVSFIIAALTALLNDYYILIVFIPFIISIMSKMKLDKVTAFAATFGSILIGFIGSVYSAKITGINVSTFSVGYNDFIWFKLCLFLISYGLFNTFTILNLRTTLKSKKVDVTKEFFVSETTTKNKSILPMAITLGVFTLVTILAYLPWVEVFNIQFFTELTKNIKEFNVLGAPVFSYVLGSVEAFGTWDLFGIQILMLIAAFIIKIAYKIDNNDFITAFGEGFAKVGKLVVLLLMSFLILEFVVMYPILPTIVDWIMSIFSKFNVVLGTISGLVSGIFTTEYQYSANLVGTYLAGSYAEYAKQISIMMQSTFGIAALIAPSSAVLLVGLSYLGISYKEWFRHVWKFLLSMTVVTAVLTFIVIKIV